MRRKSLSTLLNIWRDTPTIASNIAAWRIFDAYPAQTTPFATYDGDSPTSARPAIRTQARLILSNPDMLHVAILPHHTKWADLFRHLRFVVIDEMHVYRGVFGSHVANVLRRLKRIAHFYQEQGSGGAGEQGGRGAEDPISNLQSPIHPDLCYHCQPHRTGRAPHRRAGHSG